MLFKLNSYLLFICEIRNKMGSLTDSFESSLELFGFLPVAPLASGVRVANFQAYFLNEFPNLMWTN